MIGAARIKAHKGRRLSFTARWCDRVSGQNETLCGEKYQRGIAMMMRERILRSVVVTGAYVVGATAIFYVACESIGEMHMMMRMFDAIHNPDIGLCR